MIKLRWECLLSFTTWTFFTHTQSGFPRESSPHPLLSVLPKQIWILWFPSVCRHQRLNERLNSFPCRTSATFRLNIYFHNSTSNDNEHASSFALNISYFLRSFRRITSTFQAARRRAGMKILSLSQSPRLYDWERRQWRNNETGCALMCGSKRKLFFHLFTPDKYQWKIYWLPTTRSNNVIKVP